MERAPGNLLVTMPLHAITATYGTDGLRDRLAAECATFSPSERARLDQALALASRVHAADRRVTEPYVNHLLRVAIRILSHYGVRDPDVACAALLHDAVEDHPAEVAAAGGAEPATGGDVQQAALQALARGFGPRVADLVAAVTNPPWDPARDAAEQYREHVAASLERNPWARVIKVSDFTDNGAGLIHTTGPKVPRLAAKYAPLVPVLRDLVTRPDTPLSGQARQRVLNQLDRAAERFAAITSG